MMDGILVLVTQNYLLLSWILGRVSRARLDPDRSRAGRLGHRPLLSHPARAGVKSAAMVAAAPVLQRLRLAGVGVISLDACRNDARLMIAAVLSDRQSVKISRG